MMKQSNSFLNLLNTIHILRSPGGCPWDLSQTYQSLRPFLQEEVHELLDVLDNVPNAQSLNRAQLKNNLIEELGDVLLVILLESEIAHQDGFFSFMDVVERLNQKLIARHEHVFKSSEAVDLQTLEKRWITHKKKEKKGKSLLFGLPKNLNALTKTVRMLERTRSAGFDLSCIIDLQQSSDYGQQLFNLAQKVAQSGLNPEEELRRTNRHFER